MKVEIILEIMVIRLEAWVILIRIRPIRHTRFVKVMICRVGNIRKRGRSVIWITIKFEKIIVISHITQKCQTQTKKIKKISKQIKRKKNLT